MDMGDGPGGLACSTKLIHIALLQESLHIYLTQNVLNTCTMHNHADAITSTLFGAVISLKQGLATHTNVALTVTGRRLCVGVFLPGHNAYTCAQRTVLPHTAATSRSRSYQPTGEFPLSGTPATLAQIYMTAMSSFP